MKVMNVPTDIDIQCPQSQTNIAPESNYFSEPDLIGNRGQSDVTLHLGVCDAH